jgi:hypothetical protein
MKINPKTNTSRGNQLPLRISLRSQEPPQNLFQGIVNFDMMESFSMSKTD